jgi:hypothetical protein
MNTFAVFETERAPRYLAKLCHHFGRKVQAQCDTTKGWVEFPFGRCDMTADETRLELVASAEDQKRLDQVMQILTSHLERFAFRENPALDWQTSPK